MRRRLARALDAGSDEVLLQMVLDDSVERASPGVAGAVLHARKYVPTTKKVPLRGNFFGGSYVLEGMDRVPAPTGQAAERLYHDLRSLIASARERVAQTANSSLVMLYWAIGRRISTEVLQGRRAAYGERVLAVLSDKLTSEFGRGFTKPALVRMAQFATKFAKQEIVATLSQQLGWSHFVELIPLDDRLRLDFYAEMCRLERWSVRTLRKKIGSMLYERTALSKKPEKLAELELKGLREADKLTPDMVFRDPYLLDFLDLHGNYQETDLEAAILREMEAFILELGVGFSFVARQKRMQIGDRDYYLDLLFYHRKLKRLVAIELKLERFKVRWNSISAGWRRMSDSPERPLPSA
jgi:predicted nuclease of restriction endonuclease-like (RecB) superfamily